jgi:phospholipase/carboxylesterase
MSIVTYGERPAAGEADGLLVLHHGRGTNELDLLPLGDALDPGRRLHVIAPRAPLTLPGAPGYHWYLVPRVGHPDPQTFAAAFAALAEFHDGLWERTGIAPERTVLGGFSMGTAMSYALGLDRARPAPAGLLAFSGFVPPVEGWQADLSGRTTVRAFIAHGRRDPVIDIGLAHRARQQLQDGGLQVDYHESDAAHHIDPAHILPAVEWLEATVARASA